MSMTPDVAGAPVVQSVDRAFRIIESIQERRGATLAELVEEFDIAKSTVHRHLKTLEKHGYVVEEGGQYYVGLRFLDPAIHARQRKDEYGVIEPKVERLARETGERAQLIVAENGVGIHVYCVVGENGIQSESRVGKTVYLHTTSAGKAMLAHMSDETVEAILDAHGLPEVTENTITDREELYEELDTVRERGYAYNVAERRRGLQAIGAPVLSPDDDVLGAISVTGPVRRMQSEHEEYLPELLLDLTEEIRLRLEYPQ